MRSTALTLLALCLCGGALAAEPDFAPIDEAMAKAMADRSIPAAVICVSKGKEIVHQRGFGFLDREKVTPLPADALMRVASLAKPVTAAGIYHLVADGKLALDAKVFELLEITPHGDPDPRLGGITVQHLLDHKGGWDRKKSGDPMFKAIAIAKDLGVESPPTREQIIAWVIGRPLDNAPGSKRAYSNFGYLLLGRIIEKVTSADATAWIAEHIVKNGDFMLARTFLQDRDAREPFYHHPSAKTPNVYRPEQKVLWPDGGWDSESMDTHGGWAFSAPAYTDFLTRYWISGKPRVEDGYHYTAYGSLPGTWAVARQRLDGAAFTAIFNQRTDPSGLDYKAITDALDAALDTVYPK